MSIIFQDNEVFEFDDCFILKNELIKNGIDSSGWRLYYKNDISNWIVFYPYS